MIHSGNVKKERKNPNDPARFIGKPAVTEDGEAANIRNYLDTDKVTEEALYDGMYAVTTDLLDELGKYYYDTALAPHENALESVERIAPGHTLFGSDSFYASQKKGEQFVTDLERLLEPERREQVFHKNAERLFR